MGTIKTQCPCGMLWLSETLGGYDTICDHDGKICGAVNYQDEQFQIIQPEECKRHKRDTMEELKSATIFDELRQKATNRKVKTTKQTKIIRSNSIYF